MTDLTLMFVTDTYTSITITYQNTSMSIQDFIPDAIETLRNYDCKLDDILRVESKEGSYNPLSYLKGEQR